MNIFAQHRARNASKTTVKKAPPEEHGEVKNNITKTLQQLFKLVLDDVKRLKDTEKSKRDGLKIQLISKYQDSLDEQCAEESWTGNLFIFWNILWRFDVGNFTDGWKLALLGFERGLTADKEVFKRNFPTIIADTIYEWAQDTYDNEESESPILAELISMLETADGLNIHPAVHSKLLKLQAILITKDNPKLALTYFEKATELAPKIGVKGRMDDIKKRLKLV
ncbi:phage terminase small subunit [Bathymodiolus septemdierum thioautotrophic gill symbiont]|uniref:Terminase, endonuclease subunit n=1 Tax=endosymbiont of Bathymodiolus septemdierum str. Myojin knoll TaxID=1303921 RepID=A0A0P0URF0_9GAMM|nr:phage terminase small subunit [Bathymodiolus septemdierum thioautotrophic gill symbiont]BAS67620.1 terminase, endonuclease subunit [endosymbiont of Bathymodiolus septemdierum str. Myojin knoll]